MPSANDILEGLRTIAREWVILALVWHVYFGVLTLSLVLGTRPSQRLVGYLMVIPIVTVSALAWNSGNPFNGVFFALLAMLALAVTMSLPATPALVARWPRTTAGAMMFAFGWTYPHFLETDSWVNYLYAAPIGLIPCPTLAAIIGFGLMLRGFNSVAWTVILGVTGIFYGMFGAIRLGVSIDWFLAAGALCLLTRYATSKWHGNRGAI